MKHAICYLFKNVKLIFASMKQQNKGRFLSFKTLFSIDTVSCRLL